MWFKIQKAYQEYTVKNIFLLFSPSHPETANFSFKTKSQSQCFLRGEIYRHLWKQGVSYCLL